MNMRIPKPIPRGRPGGPVLPDVLIRASFVRATEPRSRPGVNHATALMLSSSVRESSPSGPALASGSCVTLRRSGELKPQKLEAGRQ
jgi:hypothetical protein